MSDGHWLAGFLDGEGCFDIACQRHRRDQRGYEYHYCRLSTTLRADDVALLRACAEQWGGHVYVSARTNVPETHRPKARWEVSARPQLAAIAAADCVSAALKETRRLCGLVPRARYLDVR